MIFGAENIMTNPNEFTLFMNKNFPIVIKERNIIEIIDFYGMEDN
jgi:hypothetical protein